jgi:hypothetical protein
VVAYRTNVDTNLYGKKWTVLALQEMLEIFVDIIPINGKIFPGGMRITKLAYSLQHGPWNWPLVTMHT